ncbi:MAG: hypothetical protein J4G19_05240, partial [Pseudomonadales bacterium]|nr:hypothetical protein [Pseudomonadales bacterium]
VPLYESSFYIENAEPVPGLITVQYGTSDFNESEGEYEVTQPIKIPGYGSMQIALTSEQPLERIRVNPYLSYNRTPFSIHVPRRRVYDEVARSEMPLVQAASWQYEDGDSVVVDDLDAGFSVDTTEESRSMPWFMQFLTFAFGETTHDQGLASYSGYSVIFEEWSRQQLDQAYGKYRRTLARAFDSSTVANAHFEANLPRSGSWKLEYHLPNPESIGNSFGGGFGPAVNFNIQVGERRGRQRWGDFDIWVTDGDRVVPIEFDGESIDDGWNLLGEFQLENPLVTVSVSTNTSRGSVVADAIRWTPAS